MNHKTDHTSVIVHKILIRTLNSTILRALASQPEISTELDNLVRDSNTLKFIFRTIDLLSVGRCIASIHIKIKLTIP